MIILFQSKFADQVAKVVSDKEHISDGINQDFFLDLILLMSAFFVFLSCLFICFMLYSRIKLNQQNEKEALLREKYQNFLSSFLLLPNDDVFFGIAKNSSMENRLTKKDITNKRCRTLLATEIYELKKMVRGQQESQLCNYFLGLGLQEEVLQLLKSSTWTNKVKAMQLVRSFNLKELLPMINQHIDSINRELSIHAIVARIAIDKNVSVLEEVKYKLNSWELHKVYDIIKSTNINRVAISSFASKHLVETSHFAHDLNAAFEMNHAVLELA